MKKNKSVLILSPFFAPNIGGVETHLTDLCNYLRTHDRQVYVLTFQPLTTPVSAPFFEEKRNLKIWRPWWFGGDLFHKLEPYPILEFLYLTPVYLLYTFLFMWRYQKRIDIIHAQGFTAGLVAKIISLIFSKPYLVSLHAIYGLDSGSLMTGVVRWSLKSAKGILTLSKPSRKELVRMGLAPSKIAYYRHWVDQKVFKPIAKDKAKKKLGWEGQFVVLFVGRLIEIKGAGILAKIAEQEPKITFVFIGTGPEEKILADKAKKIKNIKFLGKIENHKLPIYYSAADVFAIPSQYEEIFGRVVLEALSCGTPVIASNRGGLPEIITPDIGVLVDPNEKSFQNALENLYLDRSKLEELTKNCRQYAITNFSEKNAGVIVNNYFRLFE